MDLHVTKVPRALDAKPRLFGFELPDLLILLLYLSVSNLLFGATRLKLPLVWGATVLLAILMRLAKKGKPENHLQHLGEYWAQSDIFAAGSPDVQYQPYAPFQDERDK